MKNKKSKIVHLYEYFNMKFYYKLLYNLTHTKDLILFSQNLFTFYGQGVNLLKVNVTWHVQGEICVK